MKYAFKAFSCLLLTYLLHSSILFGQSPDPISLAGLFFSGNHIPPASPYRNVPAYKLKIKTKLQLTHERPLYLKGNYSVKFKASFWADFSHGNIFKVENGGYSLKFNFDHHPDSATVLLLLSINGEQTPVSFRFRRNELYDGKWFDFLFEVDEATGIITGKVNGTAKSFRTKPFLWTKESHISFGADGTTHDCAAMMLKDLKLSINGILEHHWLFTEMEGNNAYDSKGDLDAYVTNHDWLTNLHFKTVEKDSFFIRSAEPVQSSIDKSRKHLIIRSQEGIRIYDLTYRTFRILPSLPVSDSTGTSNEPLEWNSPSFEFDDRENQLRYFLFQYPGKDGVLIRIFIQRLPVLTATNYSELLESSPTRVRERNARIFTWIFAGAGLLLVVLTGYLIRRSFRKKSETPAKKIPAPGRGDVVFELPGKNYITIFGGLKLVNESGLNIAEALPPKLKELTAMIVYYSAVIKDNQNRGADFKLLEDIFWVNIKPENIKNNRNVAFSGIRKALENFSGLTLSVEKNRVSFETTEDIMNRLEEFFTLVDHLNDSESAKDENAYMHLSRIVSEGIALDGLHSEWAENTRSLLRYKIIGVLEKYLEILFERKNYRECIKIAGIAFMHDPLHEVTLKMMVRSQVLLGETSQAEESYDLFCSRYREVYNEDFPFELEELLED